MDILKTQLQIVLGVVICVLIYLHFNKPQAEVEVSMDMIEQKSAELHNPSNPLARSAQSQADQIMSSGDIAELESQMNQMGLLK